MAKDVDLLFSVKNACFLDEPKLYSGNGLSGMPPNIAIVWGKNLV